uniref:Multidrug resistance-associated ABC transporter n=1 Tax=Psilocybe cubensis TaxID=181762 RepID=A0A8H7XJS6_PSICU
MSICNNRSVFEFNDPCIRASWSALLPFGLVGLLCLSKLPKPRPVQRLCRFLQSPLHNFLTLREAEALDNKSAIGRAFENDNIEELPKSHVRRHHVAFAFIGAAEGLCWIVSGSFQLYDSHNNVDGILCYALAFSWIYTAIRPLVPSTSKSAPYDVVVIYLLFFVGAIVDIGGIIYDYAVLLSPLPSQLSLLLRSVNLLAIVSSLIIIFNIPSELPSAKVDPQEIGHTLTTEDYATLWQWVSFSWIYPLIRSGRYATLHEKDVWNISPTMQSRPLFAKFSALRQTSLFRRIWAANSLDIIIDLTLTIVSVVLQYTGPYFLKKILDTIDVEVITPEKKVEAYTYGFLAFFCTILKTQSDLQHLWFARRASTRIRSELMTSIYAKALKRKDFSAIVDQSKVTDSMSQAPPTSGRKGKAGSKGKSDTSDDPKPGASTGKIVNLMSSDSNRISRMVTIIFNLYGAPFEIIIACTFLYQLLGISAFAGFLVLVVGWPLNNFLARRNVRINKGIMSAQDKRMGVLNELIRAIKFIKLFAWEERWIARAMEARELELKWIRKARINQILFHLLTNSAPILVSIISFFAYVMSGNELTISTAFTAIALFSMVRAPLKVLPTYLVQILQAQVALERISVYLDEEEVTEQVSTLKRNSQPSNAIVDEGLGLSNATLRWNEVTVVEKKDKARTSSISHPPATTSVPEIAVVANEGSSSDSTTLESNEVHKFELSDISVKFPEGKLTVVTGPTASGKTALLASMAILGEMTLVSGRILLSKDPNRVDENGLMYCISYAAQLPWLLHRSIKENIIFGYPFDEERYNAVVECCALLPDLQMLEDGDATEIGARGVNLSGGQKARVALARAVYARTKFVLLDDPLSAVDSHTARFLFDRLLCGPLLANRTVVLVTHHVNLVLPAAHYLVRMLDGRIDTQGGVHELREQGVLSDIVVESSIRVHEEVKVEVEQPEAKAALEDQLEPKIEVKKPRKLVSDEFRETGGVKWSIYNTYLKASSYRIWFILAVIVFVNQFLGIAEKLWIRTWGEAYRNETSSTPYGVQYPTILTINLNAANDQTNFGIQQFGQAVGLDSRTPGPFGIVWPSAMEHPLLYIGIYAAIGMITTLVSVLSVTAQYTGALRASRILFKRLLVAIVHATFRFHDITPQGRILNRFGKDMDTIDSSLAGTLQAVNSALAGFLVAILTVAVVLPYFCIPAFFIGLIYRELALGYLNTGRDLRRMEATTRSPIYSHFGEMLEGIVTVRAFCAERRFLDGLYVKIDTTTKAAYYFPSMWYMFWMTNRWLLVNFDTLGALIVLLTTLFSISILKNDAGLAALCITSAMAFTLSVYWTCRYWTTLELDLNSVERLIEYLDVPQEPPAIIETKRAPAYWPSSSSNTDLLVVENLEVKYAPELPSVINDVSFSLKAGERIGLLGRTGSGKSTLATSLMRFVEPTNGRITIDGIDISTIGVYDLRSKITFIPQDATLFSGTLRENLDPFGDHSDGECTEALRRVRMFADDTPPTQSIRPSRTPSRASSMHSEHFSTATTNIDSKPSISLDAQVSAGGTNFSQGQRQLIAMARALIRRSPIIIFDEATSSIDFETDSIIQATIREEFSGSLLLTVAHRLRTIIDYDRLIILDKGKIVEFDTPWNLIQKEDGVFRSMCMKTGTFSELEDAAKAASLTQSLQT